jgi:thiol:disulfide interchange protein
MFTVAALLGPAIGHAAAVEPGTTLHQDPPINWDATGYTDEDCPDLQAGQVAWHFVLTSTTDANTMTLYTEFDTAGSLQTVSTKQSGPVLHWYVFTGRDTLLGAWTDAIGDNLNLSHICVGPDETTSTSTTTETTTTETTTDETTTDETTTDETTTDETTTDETTTDETTTDQTTSTDETTTDETTTDQTTSTDETTTDQTTSTDETTTDPTTSTTNSGEVSAETGTPKPTLPPTSTVGGGSSSDSGSISLGLLLLALGSLSLVLVSPSPKKTRR